MVKEEKFVQEDDVNYESPGTERRMSASGRRISTVDAVFGEIVEGGPDYRSVSILR